MNTRRGKKNVFGTRYEHKATSDRKALTGKVIYGDSYYNRTINSLWQMIRSYNNGDLPGNEPKMKETRVDTDIPSPPPPKKGF